MELEGRLAFHRHKTAHCDFIRKSLSEIGRPKSLRHVAEELRRRRAGNQPGLKTSVEKLLHGGAAPLAISERPAIHVHAHELVGDIRIHVPRELHRVLERLRPMFEPVGHALPDGARDAPAHLRAQRPAYGIAAERQRQLRGIEPPLPQIHHALQTQLWEQKLPFVDQHARIHSAGANRIGGLQFAVAGRDEVLRRALEPLLGAIPVERMREAVADAG